MNTILYGGCDNYVINELKKNLNVKCNIHSIKNFEKDFSNQDLNNKNFEKSPRITVEGQKMYEEFYLKNFTKFNSIIVRRGIFLSSFYDIRDEFSQYFHNFFEIIKVNKIELIIFFSFPHEGPDYILYKLAKSLGIKTILLYQTIFDNRFFIISDLDQFGKINYDESKKPENFEHLLDYHNQYINNVQNFILRNVNIMNSPFKTFLNSRRKTKTILIKLLNFLNILNRKDYQIEYKNNLKKLFISKKEFKKVFEKKTKKIYFPLHFQPELSTSVLGGSYDDQILVIERLSMFAGDNWDIIIKDNPRQTYYQRGSFFFKRLKNFSNIHVVDSMHDSLELIKKSDLVATVTGTPGWEAIKYRKKVLVFGNSWYSYIHGCLRVNNNTSDEEIHNFLNQSYNDNKFKSDFNRLFSQSFEGITDIDANQFYKTKNYNQEKNSKKVVLNILDYIKNNF